jgi:MYXO-CTERM domain-containing protein
MRCVLVAFLTLAAPAAAHADPKHTKDNIHEAVWLHWPVRHVRWTIQASTAVGLSSSGRAAITPSDVHAAALEAFATWSAPPCTDIAFHYEGWLEDRDTSMTTGKDDADRINKIVIRDEDWPDGGCDSGDAIACTTVVYRRGAGELLDADIDLNDRDFDFALDPRTAPGAMDLVSILTHEAGHFIGFDHDDGTDGHVMSPSIDPGEVRRELSEAEVAMVCETYPTGECTVVNDFGDQMCGGAWTPPGCYCGMAPTPTTRAGWPLVVLGLLLLRRRRWRPR